MKISLPEIARSMGYKATQDNQSIIARALADAVRRECPPLPEDAPQ